MSGDGEDQAVFEIAVVVPKRSSREGGGSYDCVEVLVGRFGDAGLQVERLAGIGDEEFIKLSAPLKTIGRAAKELHMKKPTRFGMDLQFEWDEIDVFVRQPDGSVFSWFERFHCYHHLIYGIVNNTNSVITLKFDGKAFNWEVGESLLTKLESEGIVKQVFPLHDETKRRNLLKNWAFNWWDLTEQPIDEIYSYFGTKIAIYFTFLGMYTRWMVFPAVFGVLLQLGGFRSMELLIPLFFGGIILWAVLFFQFWKRKNSAILARWQISYSFGASQGYKHLLSMGRHSQRPALDLEILKSLGMDKKKQKAMFQRHEWFGCLMRFRNDAIIILSIVCLQFPFELAYAHLFEVAGSNVVKYGVTAAYLLLIQYFTRIGGKLSVKLIKYENNENTEYQADSLVYKVFGLYFMQSYIGVFYHAYLHRNFMSLRQILVQRLIVASVLDNLLESSLPYIIYKYKRYTAMKNKAKDGGSASPNRKGHSSSRVEKEYLKPAYSATIGEDLEDGLFNDFLELTLQFGMIMMFACAFPVIFAFALLNNIMEIRTDALKLLVMLRRPVPRAATTIGAWLNIFQFLIVMAIVSNSVLLVCLYDREGTWKIDPGLAGILIMEHCLLLVKFGFSGFVPEEPAWVRANRMKHESLAMDVCSRQLLRCISEEEKEQLSESKKNQ